MTGTHDLDSTTRHDAKLDVRRLRPGDAAYMRALGRVLSTTGTVSPESAHETVTQFLDSIAGGPATLDLVFATMERETVTTACAAVGTPGHSALVMLPHQMPTNAAVAVLSRQAQAAWAEGLRLLEILTIPGNEQHTQIFTRSGYRRLTALIYMRCRVSAATPQQTRTDLSWQSFSPDTAPQFMRAIADSYEQSLDCPELSELRTAQDAIEGHRAAGEFDPKLWWVALSEGVPVGLILLSRIRSRAAVELVYMGVSVAARGSGVGNALLSRGFQCAKRVGANTVALAVDQRNRHALHLYARSGFIEVGLRDAWIASPHT